jgi:serine/threonine protein kinase
MLVYMKPLRMLNWRTRVGVIEGIAQEFLYFHQYFRLRIIHRDLKLGNILLDIDMNPKISDFGMARIFGGNESPSKYK